MNDKHLNSNITRYSVHMGLASYSYIQYLELSGPKMELFLCPESINEQSIAFSV